MMKIFMFFIKVMKIVPYPSKYTQIVVQHVQKHAVITTKQAQFASICVFRDVSVSQDLSEIQLVIV